MSTLITAIRRHETPVTRILYGIYRAVYGFSFPVFKPLHSLLYFEWSFRMDLWHNFWRIVYYEPMFKSQCVHVGKGFLMEYAGNGSTRIAGSLSLHIGDNVTIYDNSYFVGLKVLDKPSLYIGDSTYIGPRVNIMVGKEIRIGSHCLIAAQLITDNPGHSIVNALSRSEIGGGSPEPESIKPIVIGDYCFLPQSTIVYPGVTIGDGVVARVGSHIARDVPAFCLVGGMPATIRKLLPIPAALEKSDPGKYGRYKAEHRKLMETSGLSYATVGNKKHDDVETAESRQERQNG